MERTANFDLNIGRHVSCKDIVVMKFGGTSVGSGQAIVKTGEILESQLKNQEAIIVVVSAIRGVTDSLVRICNYIQSENEEALELEIEDVLDKHEVVMDDLELPRPLMKSLGRNIEIYKRVLAESVKDLGGLTLPKRDEITGLGERFNSQIVASFLNSRGIRAEAIDATEIIETDNSFGNANPDFRNTSVYAKRKLLPLVKEGVVPVVTGFIGGTKDYKPTTLGRGGSDYTASILGRVLSAKEVWIWTDVCGVYSTDPAKDPNAMVIPYLTYRQADKMAKEGAKVLFEKTIEPLIGTGTILRVKNTFEPDFVGTEISEENCP